MFTPVSGYHAALEAHNGARAALLDRIATHHKVHRDRRPDAQLAAELDRSALIPLLQALQATADCADNVAKVTTRRMHVA